MNEWCLAGRWFWNEMKDFISSSPPSAFPSLQNHYRARSQPKLSEPIYTGTQTSELFMHTTGDFDA